MRPACFFHPLTTIFLDDDEVFLNLIRFGLDKHEKMSVFTDSDQALEVINADKEDVGSAIFKSYNDVDTDHPSIKQIDLNIDQIKNAIYDANRFNHIGVLLVDYQMPKMSGIDVCRHIANRHIYKVLLTAEASLDTAIEAFNEAVIDKFVPKSNHDLLNVLSGILCELNRKYFHDISKPILTNLNERLTKTLNTEIFIELFNNVFHESNAVEYYLLDASGSYLFLDKTGFPTWLIIRNEQDFHDQLEILSGLEATQEMIKSLQSHSKLLFLLDENEYQQPVEEWKAGLFDAKPLNDSLWYAIAKGPIKKSIAWDKVKPYQGSR